MFPCKFIIIVVTLQLQIYRTMEHKFRKSDNDIDLQALLDFCKKEGKMVEILHVGSAS